MAFTSTAYYLDGNVFVIPAYVGYFVLGAYLVNVKVTNRKLLAGLTVLGVALSALGTYIIAMSVGGGTTYFFQEYVSPTMILAAVPFFLLLNSHKSKPATADVKPSWAKRIMHVISENTLPIFLFHMMVIYTLQHGLLGVTLNGDVVNSIVGVPLMAGCNVGDLFSGDGSTQKGASHQETGRLSRSIGNFASAKSKNAY